MDLEKKKQAEWRKQERQWGRYMPQAVREAIEDQAGSVYDLQDFEYFKSTLADYVSVVVVALQHMTNGSKRQSEHVSGEATTRKRSQRCFEKRLHLVEFIAEYSLTMKSMLEETFAHHKRFNWKRVCADWNEVHPHDPFTPSVLQHTYYRAVADPDIQQEYFERRYNEVIEKVKPSIMLLADYILRIGESSLGSTEQAQSVAQLVIESLMKRFGDSDQSDYSNLIQVCEHLSSFLNSMSDSEKEEDINRMKARLKEGKSK